MTEDSNIGEIGVESIRIRGKKIENLPLGQGNEAVAGLAAARAAERLNNINTINADYPKHRIDYLLSRINECRENITRINNTIGQQSTMINDYKGHIGLCTYRDKEMAKLEDASKLTLGEDDYKAQIKDLKKRFPPYNVDAMNKQIVQCNEAIERCNDVIKQENDSINEFEGVLALCRKRDIELAKWGARAEGS